MPSAGGRNKYSAFKMKQVGERVKLVWVGCVEWCDDGNVVADADSAHPMSDLGKFLKLCLSGSTCKMSNPAQRS